jgi:hypothetical protein
MNKLLRNLQATLLLTFALTACDASAVPVTYYIDNQCKAASVSEFTIDLAAHTIVVRDASGIVPISIESVLQFGCFRLKQNLTQYNLAASDLGGFTLYYSDAGTSSRFTVQYLGVSFTGAKRVFSNYILLLAAP